MNEVIDENLRLQLVFEGLCSIVGYFKLLIYHLLKAFTIAKSINCVVDAITHFKNLLSNCSSLVPTLVSRLGENSAFDTGKWKLKSSKPTKTKFDNTFEKIL